MTYLPSIDKFISRCFIYTPDELDFYDGIEKELLIHQQQPRLYELLTIFPEAKSAVNEVLQDEIKKDQDSLAYSLAVEREGNNIISGASPINLWFWKMVLDELYVNPLREGRERRIKRNRFILSFLKDPEKKTNGITNQDIQRAKEVPLDQLIEFNRAGFAHCPLQGSDKTPSLHYYKKENRWFCFSCHEGTDSIDLVMKMREVDFIEAVKILLNP